jgi:hypothetical protein
VKLSQFTETGDFKQDIHDDSFTVTVEGKLYSLSCSDSGDGDCECGVN